MVASLIVSGWNWLGKGRAATVAMRTKGRSGKGGVQDRLAAFEQMVFVDWERFHRYALRLCQGSADDAEDLLSESMLDAFRSFDSYRGDGFDRWFFRMITNNRIDMARRAKVRRTESLDSAYSGDSGETHGRDIADEAKYEPERKVLDPIYSEPVEQALNHLSEEFRIAILLCDVEQLDYVEIATLLDIPIGTVRSRIHRGRHQMRQYLEKIGWNPGD